MLRMNKEKLAMLSVMGEIAHPRMGEGFKVSHDGNATIVPGIGAITYNVSIGDSVYGWEVDHLEPGVSIHNSSEMENTALSTLACIGNEAKVITGEGKGMKGFVTGNHGGRYNTMVYFDPAELDNLAIGDKIQIKSYGLGLRFLDYPEVKVMSVDPKIIEAMKIEEKDGFLHVPVVAEVPPYLMGSGIGMGTPHRGDYDIITADWEVIKKWNLDKLRFGDLVLLRDCDNTYGRGYYTGSVSIGVVVHSDCILAGHGPGVSTIMSCKTTMIKPIIDPKANIGYYLGIK